MSCLSRDDLRSDSLWKGAHELKLPGDSVVLQLQGIGSPTRTAFGRLIVLPTANGSCSRQDLTVQQVMQYMLEEIQQQEQEEEIAVAAEELLSLGSVWRLTKETKSAKKWKRTRLLSHHADDKFPPCRGGPEEEEEETSLRVHYRPSRFPAVHHVVDWTLSTSCNQTTARTNTNNPHKPSAIRYYDRDLGYCVVHKPSGVPSHATVDNGVENVLNQIQQQLQTTSSSCSLPQRLDIETEGLLLVATQAEFASFVGRLLQDKTNMHVLPVSPGKETVRHKAAKPQPALSPSTGSSIQKQYRCLVRVQCRQDRDMLLSRLSIHNNGTIDTDNHASTKNGNESGIFLHTDPQPSGILVRHYTDPKAPAPKPFVSQPKEGWHLCIMRILEVGPFLTWISRQHDKEKDCGSNPPKEPAKTEQFMMEVKVELLTGRTHQIRGQFAALNLPLVGDPLYHHDDEMKLDEVCWDETRNRGTASSKRLCFLALQCCLLAFPKPKWGTHPRTNRPILVPTENANDNVCRFTIDKAWWSDLVAIAEPSLDSMK